jgi:hypothetical protein
VAAIFVRERDCRTQFSKRTRTLWEIHITIFSSETTGLIATKLWIAPFQQCIRLSRLSTKMATKLKIEKWGDEINKKNVLLWNYWANLNKILVEWSLCSPLPNICPVIPTSNQDGRQAKNRKKGGWNFNCSLLLYYKSKWAQIFTAATWQGVV